jgi:hypothetical protein
MWDAVGLVGLLLVSSWLGQDLGASKNFGEEAQLRREVTVEFSDDGIRSENSAGNSETKWIAFIGYAESDSVFLIYLTKKLFFIIPKSAFSSDDLKEFRELLQQKLPLKK